MSHHIKLNLIVASLWMTACFIVKFHAGFDQPRGMVGHLGPTFQCQEMPDTVHR